MNKNFIFIVLETSSKLLMIPASLFLTMEILWQKCFQVWILAITHLNNGLQVIFTECWILDIIREAGSEMC